MDMKALQKHCEQLEDGSFARVSCNALLPLYSVQSE